MIDPHYQNSRFPEGTCLGTCTEPAPKPCMQSMALPIPHTWLSSPPGGKHAVEDRWGHTSGWRGREPRGADGPMHWPEGRPCPCAPARPKPWMQLWAPDACPASGGTPCSQLPVWPWGLLAESRSCSPQGPGAEGTRQCRHCPGSARRAVARRAVAGWQEGLSVELGPASTGMSGLLLENRAPLHPVMAVQGLQILCLLQRTKPRGTMRSRCCPSAWAARRACSWGRECWWKPPGAGGVGSVRAWLWLCYVPSRAQCWHIPAV